MYKAVVCIVAEAGSRIKMLLRVRPFYSNRELISLYKCHVLSFLESGTPAYYHAAPSILKLVDEMQDMFLESIGIPKRDALLTFNLAPLCVRRDIAMLGVLHKVVLGIAPAPFEDIFKRSISSLRCFGFRSGPKLHDKQLEDKVGNNSPILLKRSLFGLVHVYNRLTQDVVDTGNVQQFQKRLQCIVKNSIDTNPKWDLIFHRAY